MDDFQGHFLCTHCENSDFMAIYNFSLHFHKVNFSEKLVYDDHVIELYKCTKCEKTFTRQQIEEGLTELRRKCMSA